jgi:hypothetical protein
MPAKKLANGIQGTPFRTPLAHMVVSANDRLTLDRQVVQTVWEKSEACVTRAECPTMQAIDEFHLEHVAVVLFLAGGEDVVQAARQ